jgi:hypothetical protein
VALNNDKAVFEVNVKGEGTGKVYSGKFVMKLFLSLKDRNAAAVKYSKLNQGNTEDFEMMGINKMLAEYSIQAEDSPSWFANDAVMDLEDFSPLVKIKEELEQAQKEYADKMNK